MLSNEGGGINEKVKNKSASSILLIMSLLLLAYLYESFVFRYFNYDGYSYSLSLLKMVEAIVSSLLISFIINSNRITVSGFFIVIYYLVCWLPFSVYYAVADQSRLYFYIYFFAFCLFSFLLKYFNRNQFYINVKTIRGGNRLALTISFFCLILIIVKVVVSDGLTVNFDLTKTYEFREEQGDILYSGFWGYLTNWTLKVFSIFTMVFFLHDKKYKLLFTVLAIQFFLFGVTSHKTTIFYAFFAIFLYFFIRHVKLQNYSLFYRLLSYFLAVLILLTAFLFFSKDMYVGSYLVRRALFVPAKLTFVYFDFFSNNDFIYWSNSFLSPLIEYPYDIQSSKLIGRYLGSEGMAANNGLISSGYMHMGLFGIIIYIIITMCFLRGLDYFSTNQSAEFVVAVSAPSIMSLLTSSDLLTALVTHGVAIAVIVLYFSNTSSANQLGNSRYI